MARTTNDLLAVRMVAGPALMYLVDTSIRALLIAPAMCLQRHEHGHRDRNRNADGGDHGARAKTAWPGGAWAHSIRLRPRGRPRAVPRRTHRMPLAATQPIAAERRRV